MSDIVIRVENLSKKYIIGHQKQERYTALRDVISNGAKSFWQGLTGDRKIDNDVSEEFWALKDVNFEIKQGDRVGIIGRNGAGKSTLLKILSRITEPTSGKISIKGRVASLLEVGTGFHPELTGRENIFLNGAILGMDRSEIKKKFDEIVAFAEVEKFLDTPVKRYSSGMYVRLAFAVAAHLEPEILIVDEVLAVGDAAFQKKCLGKMEDVAEKEGRTVLFVSHQMAAVENLCNQGIVLHKGSIQYIGNQSNAISTYLVNQSNAFTSIKNRTDRKGTGEVKIVGIEVKNDKGETLNAVQSGQNISIYFYFEKNANVNIKNILTGFILKTQMEVPVFLQHNILTNDDFGYLDNFGAFVCTIKNLPLVPSEYRLTYSVMSNNGRDPNYIDTLDDAINLTVIEGDFFGSGEIPKSTHGFCLVNASWYIDSSI